MRDGQGSHLAVLNVRRNAFSHPELPIKTSVWLLCTSEKDFVIVRLEFRLAVVVAIHRKVRNKLLPITAVILNFKGFRGL